jgi:hypothetical protein
VSQLAAWSSLLEPWALGVDVIDDFVLLLRQLVVVVLKDVKGL